MLILLSPAKNLNFDDAPGAPPATTPALLKDARELADVAKSLSRSRIKSLMGISQKLAELSYDRFQALKASAKAPGAKQAALAFNGDVYLGLEAGSLSADDLAFAQEHLRILSGLYGLLRPLDAIEPYRLEMGSKLKNPRGRDLYAFWGEKISREINKAVADHADGAIVNLASKEYFGAVDPKALKGPVITPVFKEEKDGKLRQLQFFAKRARGLMARWAIRNRIEDTARLKDFDVDGYAFSPDGSDDEAWLFTRPQPPLKS
ncbi:MAG: peroxide stress protein YaaA [Alphaproteobacteria bacterium]|nr:peroxide stress protein YaaA [Alphaproteobacteria bacterium]